MTVLNVLLLENETNAPMCSFGIYNILIYSMNNSFMLSVNYNTNIILKSMNTFYFTTDDILTIDRVNNKVNKNNNIYLIIYKI